MRILDRYVGRQVLLAILMVLLLIVLLDTLFGFIGQLGALRADYRLANALWFTLLEIPQRLYDYLPFAALIGCLVGLGTMANHSELVVMRAAGVSLRRMLWAVMKPALMLVALGIALGEFVVPTTSQVADSYRTVLRAQDGSYSSEGIWHRDGNEFMYFAAVEPNGVLHGVRRFIFDDSNQLIEASQARRALRQEDHWLLEDVAITHLEAERTWTERHDTQRWNTTLSPETLNVIVVAPEDLSMRGLRGYVGYLESQQLDAGEYRLAFWSKALQPLALLALVLVGISFVFGPLRSVTMGLRLSAGVVTGFSFMIVQKLLGPSSLVFGFSPIIAVLLPIGLCMLLGAYLLKRAG